MNAAPYSDLFTVTGTLLAGKYRVDRVLGQGGMGIVLAATNEALQQRVAIKLLRDPNTDARALGRFEREARAAARLRSEHVARVLDVGKLEDGRPYMVMEHLEGFDLGCLIDQGTDIPIGELVDYVLQACEGIAEAHSAGIIHRDLKPRNLFLSAAVDGRPLIKVLDFGISKIEDASADEFGLTRTTEVIGSPSYMSPEQLRASKEVDLRTDIWALGVILYELITKRVPFHAVTITELVAVILMDPTPDVRALRPDVPEGLSIAIQRCLAKRREDRFSGVAALAAAIAPYGTGAVAGMAEKISRVAQGLGSGRSLPPSDTGSGQQSPRLVDPTITRTVAVPAKRSSDISGVSESGIGGNASRLSLQLDDVATKRLAGTSVSWGETNSALEPKRRSRLPQIAGIAGLVLMTATGAGAAALYYARHSAPVRIVGGPLQETAFPSTTSHGEDLPQRTASPPSSPSTHPSASASSVSSAAALRGPDRAGAIPSVFQGKPQSKSPPVARSAATPTPPSETSGNDLSEIGRH